MTELHEALENCLQAIERGASLEYALRRYPQLADELRPMLAAALMAKDASRVHVPLDVRRRGRERLMGQVEAYERAGSPSRRVIPAFSRLAITASLLLVLVGTSTGLVSASSGSLPGQQLYPVKRTWESVRLMLVFSPQEKDLLQSEFEQERLDETSELLGLHSAAPISFAGILAKRSDGHWLVSGIPVSMTSATKLPAVLVEGVPVRVTGTTRADGVVDAKHVELLQPGSSLPPLEPSEGTEGHDTEAPENSGAVAPPVAMPTTGLTKQSSSGSETEHPSYQYSGVVQSTTGTVWQINGQPVYVDHAQISGQVSVGSIVRFQGYYSVDGKFIVTTIEVQASGSDTKHSGSEGTGSGTPSGSAEGGGESEGGGSEGP